MPIPEFHQWLEKKTEELRRNNWVQKEAYFTRPQEIPSNATDAFRKLAVWSKLMNCWVAPCYTCNILTKVTGKPSHFHEATHLCYVHSFCSDDESF